MAVLSVNVNKVATLRNARGRNLPCLEKVVEDLIHFGVRSITIHPRPDERHIKKTDVSPLKKNLLSLSHSLSTSIELNIEGYPSPSFLQMIKEVHPTQCTLVPDPPHVLTSDTGWKMKENKEQLKDVIQKLRTWSIRSSLFVDPLSFDNKGEEINTLLELHPDRVEIYTEEYARFFLQKNQREDILSTYKKCIHIVEKNSSIGFNAGHDLNAKNLPTLLKNLSSIKEVSIGHAFICEALYEGLQTTTEKYLKICGEKEKL